MNDKVNEQKTTEAKPIEPKQTIKFSPRVETRLASLDLKRLDEAAKAAGKTRADFSRQALLWYLDNLENLEHDKRETEIAQAIRYATDQIIKAINSGVDRICKMLARQGKAIGTLYELSYMALPDEESRLAFVEAGNLAAQKMRKHVEKDEAELAAASKNVVTGSGVQKQESQNKPPETIKRYRTDE